MKKRRKPYKPEDPVEVSALFYFVESMIEDPDYIRDLLHAYASGRIRDGKTSEAVVGKLLASAAERYAAFRKGEESITIGGVE